MRKLLPALIVLACFLTTRINAQVIWRDDFSDSTLANWTVVNQSTSGSIVVWKWSRDPNTQGQYFGTFNAPGATNGHIRVDSDNDGNTGNSEKTSITSKAIDCRTAPKLLLEYSEYYRKFQADSGVVYVSHDSVNWVPVFRPYLNLAANAGTANPANERIDISSIAAGDSSVYIRFTWWGEWDYYWFVDDVQLRIPDANDIQAYGINNQISNGCNLTNSETIAVVLHNAGLSAVDSLDLHYQVNNSPVVTEHVTGLNAGYDSVFTYTFNTGADMSTAGIYNISVWATLAGDSVHTNDTAFSFAVSADPIDMNGYTMGFEVPSVGGSEVGGYTWTTQDANQDLDTWQLSGSLASGGQVSYMYFYNPQLAADDWLFSPCLIADSSKAYRLTFYDQTGADANGVYPEKLEIKMGMTKSAAGMTENVNDFGEITDTSAYVERTVAFRTAHSGVYYLGFHAYSDANEYFISLDDISIDVLAPPSAQFAPAVNGMTVNVTDGSGDVITNWLWKWGDGTTSTGQNPTPHTYTQAGVYTVCLYVTNLAGTDSICHNVTIVGSGISDIDANSSIGVFPNPTNRILNVVMNSDNQDKVQMEIVNMLGETVMTAETQSNVVQKFDLGTVATGVYFVRITGNNTKAVRKFVYTR